MRKMAKMGWFLSFFMIMGCSQAPFLRKSTRLDSDIVENKTLEQPSELNRFVEKGQIIDAQRLKQGKLVAFIPFKAGVNVAANENLDRIALMIVKGSADVFNEDQNNRYKVLTAENSGQADMIVQGHVTAVKGPSKVSRWIMLKGHKMLSVEGEVIDAQNGNTIAVFSDQMTSEDKDYKELGYQIGKNISSFMLFGAE